MVLRGADNRPFTIDQDGISTGRLNSRVFFDLQSLLGRESSPIGEHDWMGVLFSLQHGLEFIRDAADLAKRSLHVCTRFYIDGTIETVVHLGSGVGMIGVGAVIGGRPFIVELLTRLDHFLVEARDPV